MSGPSALPSALDALTDKEREVLRLLVAGHTIKSIATTLGRSEASINERLRDARRKTGVGSSRELARLLDARDADLARPGSGAAAGQKNWDRKIDLPPASASGDADPAPGPTRRVPTKGSIIMLLAVPLAAAGLALAGSPAPNPAPPRAAVPPATRATGPRPSSLVGRWALDTARIPAAERPRRVTISFRLSPQRQWTTEVEIVAPDGTVQRAVSTAAADGVAVPVTGTFAAIDTASLRQPAPDTLVMTLGKGGAPVSTRVYTVARDRRTMTETIVWASQAMPGLETTTFRRLD